MRKVSVYSYHPITNHLQFTFYVDKLKPEYGDYKFPSLPWFPAYMVRVEKP